MPYFDDDSTETSNRRMRPFLSSNSYAGRMLQASVNQPKKNTNNSITKRKKSFATKPQEETNENSAVFRPITDRSKKIMRYKQSHTDSKELTLTMLPHHSSKSPVQENDKQVARQLDLSELHDIAAIKYDQPEETRENVASTSTKVTTPSQILTTPPTVKQSGKRPNGGLFQYSESIEKERKAARYGDDNFRRLSSCIMPVQKLFDDEGTDTPYRKLNTSTSSSGTNTETPPRHTTLSIQGKDMDDFSMGEPRYRSPSPLSSTKIDKCDGFPNLSNTCYINSALQCLLRLPQKTVDYQLFSHDIAEDSLLHHVLQLVPKVNITRTRKERSLSKIRKITDFAESVQQDVEEFLCKLLDMIEAQIKLINKNIPLEYFNKRFTFDIRTTTTCKSCSHKIIQNENNKMLNLDLPYDDTGKTYSLQNAVDKYFAPESIDFSCEKCKIKQKATHVKWFTTLPNVFIIHLKRYKYESSGPVKLSVGVKISLRIDFHKHKQTSDMNESRSGGSNEITSKIVTMLSPRENREMPPLLSPTRSPFTAIENSYKSPEKVVGLKGGISTILPENICLNGPSSGLAPTLNQMRDAELGVLDPETYNKFLETGHFKFLESDDEKCPTEMEVGLICDEDTIDLGETAQTGSADPVNVSFKDQFAYSTEEPASESDPLAEANLTLNNFHSATNSKFQSNASTQIGDNMLPDLDNDDPDLSRAIEASMLEATEEEDSELKKAKELSLIEAEEETKKRQSLEEEEIKRAMEESIKEAERKEAENSYFDSIIEEEQEEEIEDEMPVVPNCYRLVSVINHVGSSTNNGHYTCEVFDDVLKKWKNYNDEIVMDTQLKRILNGCKVSGYVFFYVKEKDFSP